MEFDDEGVQRIRRSAARRGRRANTILSQQASIQIVVTLGLDEIPAICLALNVTTNSMTDSQSHSRIGQTKELAQHLLDEMLAIVDTLDPPAHDDYPCAVAGSSFDHCDRRERHDPTAG